MSSIYGQLHLPGRHILDDDLLAMQLPLNHWRADDKGEWKNGAIGLGHLMLYNTPESLNEQLPLHHAESQCTITADARIDNREDIYSLLGIHAQAEQQIPDSTLILRLYQRYGIDCIQHLIGDFAFAIWDGHRQQLFCARDHMGVKPFFYYYHNGLFAFASEKKGILAIPGMDSTVDKQFFYNQLLLPVQQSFTTTLYRHIQRLAPAHTLLVHLPENRVEIKKYWTLDAEKRTILGNAKAYREAFRHHFDQAVACRLRTHYPIGAELSGGLDSTAIVGAACKYLGDSSRLTTFSSTHRADETDSKVLEKGERTYIEDAIRFHRIKNAVFITENTEQDLLKMADLSLFVNDGLEMWDAYLLGLVKPAAMQAQVRTLLSGFPGDEMITYKGKHFYLDLLEQKKYRQYLTSLKNTRDLKDRLLALLPSSLAEGLHQAGNVSKALYNTINKSRPVDIPFQYAIKRNATVWADPNYQNRYKSYRHYMIAKLLKPQVTARMESETRYGMYYRLEPRFPQADIRLTQFFLSLPNELKHYGSSGNRNFYRAAIQDYLPESIQKRTGKTGNMAPYLNNKEYRDMQYACMQGILKDITGKQDWIKIRNSNIPPGYSPTIFRWVQKNMGKY